MPLHCTAEDYDFRSRTPVAGRCVEDGGSEARRPDLQLTAALRPQEVGSFLAVL